MALHLLDEGQRYEVSDEKLEDVQGGDPETVYVYRQIPPHVNRQLSKQHTTYPINRRTGQRETVVDHLSLLDDLLDYALIGWRGILHKGQSVPCEREYKVLLDYPRKTALLQLAGMNRTAPEDREESFRPTADVLRVLGGPTS